MAASGQAGSRIVFRMVIAWFTFYIGITIANFAGWI